MLQKFFDFLLGLQHVSLRDWGKLHFSYAVDWPRIIIALICAALIVLGVWSYRAQTASPNKRLAMGILRGLSLVVLFLLFCRPQLVLSYSEPTASTVAVWVDTSASMTMEDPYTDTAMGTLMRRVTGETALDAGQTRANRHQMAMDHLQKAKWLREIVKTQNVVFFTGGSAPVKQASVLALREGEDAAQKMREVDACITALRVVKPDSVSTDVPKIVAAIGQKVKEEGAGTLSGIVLMTDGQTTTASGADSAVLALEKLRDGTQLFPIAVGQLDAPFDLRVAAPKVPAGVFVKDPVAVEVKVGYTGLTATTSVKVTLARVTGEKTESVLVEKTVDLPKGEGEKAVELVFRPEKNDKSQKSETYDLVARVVPAGITPGEESTLANNVERGSMKVYDAEMNVLYVEGYPRWEYRYLKNELIRETTVNVASLLLSADPENQFEGDVKKMDPSGRVIFSPVKYFPETKETLDEFDVIILGDVKPSEFSPSQMKLIVEHVKKRGAGLLWMGGQAFNPASFANTPLGELLPIVPEDPNSPNAKRVNNKRFLVVPTVEGKDSNLFRFFDAPEKNDQQIKELPELYWYTPIRGVRPGAQVLARHSDEKLGDDFVPLIVTAPVGKGRVVFSGIADTWRWRRYMGEPLFQTYWLQMSRLLFHDRAMEQSGRRVTLRATDTKLDINADLHLTLEIKDLSLHQVIGDRAVVNIRTANDGQLEKTGELVRRGEDRLEGSIKMTKLGNFRAELDLPGLGTERQSIDILVQPPSGERANLSVDRQGLETIARGVNRGAAGKVVDTRPFWARTFAAFGSGGGGQVGALEGPISRATNGVVLDIVDAERLVSAIPVRSDPKTLTRQEELWIKPIALALVLALLTAEWLIRKSAGLI